MLSQLIKKTEYKVHAPFLIPLLGTIAGIILTHFGFISLLNALFITLSALITFITLSIHSIPVSWITQSLVLIAFIGLSSVQYNFQKKYQNLITSSYSGKTFDAKGTITDKEILVDPRFRERLKIKISQICHTIKASSDINFCHADFYISCYIPYHSKIDIDDIVSLQNFVIKKPTSTSLAENQSFFDYLVKENIAATIFIDKKTTLVKISSPFFSCKRWLWHKRQKLLIFFKQKLSKLSFDYFSLIFLGYKQISWKNELTTTFNYWGISHYLARSGLHIVLFVVVWQFFLNLLPLALFFKYLVLLIVCLMYALMSWSSLSFYRAFFIFLLTQNGKLIHQQLNYTHLASFLGLAFLLFNPINLFFLDFQLSFGLTAILILISWVNQSKQQNKKAT